MEEENDYNDSKKRNEVGTTSLLNVACEKPPIEETKEQTLWRETCLRNQITIQAEVKRSKERIQNLLPKNLPKHPTSLKSLYTFGNPLDRELRKKRDNAQNLIDDFIAKDVLEINVQCSRFLKGETPDILYTAGGNQKPIFTPNYFKDLDKRENKLTEDIGNILGEKQKLEDVGNLLGEKQKPIYTRKQFNDLEKQRDKLTEDIEDFLREKRLAPLAPIIIPMALGAVEMMAAAPDFILNLSALKEKYFSSKVVYDHSVFEHTNKDRTIEILRGIEIEKVLSQANDVGTMQMADPVYMDLQLTQTSKRIDDYLEAMDSIIQPIMHTNGKANLHNFVSMDERMKMKNQLMEDHGVVIPKTM